jgi:hypothetical protein
MRNSPLLLFTGLRDGGVSTRVMASRVAIGHDNGFQAHEVDQDGKAIVPGHKTDELALLGLMLETGIGAGMQPPSLARYFLSVEAGGRKNQVEIWERGSHDALGILERDVEFDGIVISVPLEAERHARESELDSLIRPLRRKYWVDFKEKRPPWVILDLTKYDALFSQVVVEMLDGLKLEQWSPAFLTPYAFASRREVQELAVRSFCQRWIADNELTLLVNAERQRCSTAFRPRVMMQVSSAWGFLAGQSGPSARQPANCICQGAQMRPRFAELTPGERELLSALVRGTPAAAPEVGKALEDTSDRFYSVWQPIGVVDPIPTVVWGAPAPNMFWGPEMMSAVPLGRRR